MTKKYVIFDLDGTLIDSIPDLCKEINLLLKDNNRRPLTQEEGISIIGHGAPFMLAGAFRLTGEPLNQEQLDHFLKIWIKQYSHAQMDLTNVWDGVIETLTLMKSEGYKMAVCTNKPEVPTFAILKKLGLIDFFSVILHADSLPKRKPNPEPLWEAIRLMGGKNDQAVMVGDSEPDVDAAKNAGIPVVLLSFGYARTPLIELEPNAIVDCFSDLPNILRSLD